MTQGKSGAIAVPVRMRGGAKRFDAGDQKMLFCCGLAVALRPAQQ